MKRLVSVLLSMLAVVLLFASVFGADRDSDLKRPTTTTTKSETKAAATTSTTVKPATTAPAAVEPAPVVEAVPTVEVPQASAAETVTWQVLSSGGGVQSLGTMTLGSTIGQTAVGVSSLGSYQLNSGFWQNWTVSESCCVIRGDVNHAGDGFDISDIVYFVNWLFLSGPTPNCMEEADANASGGDADISDLVYLVGYMFQGGPAPIPCD